jgi:hypothetical protein
MRRPSSPEFLNPSSARYVKGFEYSKVERRSSKKDGSIHSYCSCSASGQLEERKAVRGLPQEDVLDVFQIRNLTNMIIDTNEIPSSKGVNLVPAASRKPQHS